MSVNVTPCVVSQLYDTYYVPLVSGYVRLPSSLNRQVTLDPSGLRELAPPPNWSCDGSNQPCQGFQSRLNMSASVRHVSSDASRARTGVLRDHQCFPGG